MYIDVELVRNISIDKWEEFKKFVDTTCITKKAREYFIHEMEQQILLKTLDEVYNAG